MYDLTARIRTTRVDRCVVSSGRVLDCGPHRKRSGDVCSLVLDAGVLIAAGRNAKPVSELLAKLEEVHGETEIVLSSIT
jgi:hypothetical protein